MIGQGICFECSPLACPGDLDGNCVVDGNDVNILFADYGICQ
jgi:hypothetical protein